MQHKYPKGKIFRLSQFFFSSFIITNKTVHRKENTWIYLELNLCLLLFFLPSFFLYKKKKNCEKLDTKSLNPIKEPYLSNFPSNHLKSHCELRHRHCCWSFSYLDKVELCVELFEESSGMEWEDNGWGCRLCGWTKALNRKSLYFMDWSCFEILVKSL